MCAGASGAPPDEAQSSSSPSSIRTTYQVREGMRATTFTDVSHPHQYGCECLCSVATQCDADAHVSVPLTSGHPNTPKTDAGTKERISFGSVLERSICRQQRIHGWCEQCAKYKSTVGAGVWLRW